MIILSPKWIYLDNKSLASDKSILVDGGKIANVLTENDICKNFNEVKRIYYKNHIMMPSLTDAYISFDDCINNLQYEKKINNILLNGVTKLQIVTKDYKNFLKLKHDDRLDISFMITLDGSKCTQSDINDMIKTLDFHKSNPNQLFNINIMNILKFDNQIIEKVASIANEIQFNVHIHLNDLIGLSKKDIEGKIKYYDDINILNNCAIHDAIMNRDEILANLNKKNISICVKYSELKTFENIKRFISLIEREYNCILISDKEKSFRFYDLTKITNLVNRNLKTFDSNKIFNCVTVNTERCLSNSSHKNILSKGSTASFNLYDQSKKFLLNNQYEPELVYLDNESLTNVWSTGKEVYAKY